MIKEITVNGVRLSEIQKRGKYLSTEMNKKSEKSTKNKEKTKSTTLPSSG